jgi:hypothetical protein
MTDAVYSRAKEAFEATSSVGGLERSIAILVHGGVDISHVRTWARSTAEAYGIWPYVAPDFARLMIGARNLAQAEEG